MSTEPRAIVELDGVRKRYNVGRPNEAEVLHGISLVLREREFAALIGPSGSGKSTLLNILGLLESMSEGSYRLQGEEVGGLDDAGLTLRRRATLGFVFQFHHLLPAFSALENVTLPALMRDGRVSAAQREHAREVLAAVGLAAAMDKRPGELSGGMQQRVAIARALAMRPKVMLFDEVTSALDPELVGEVLQVIRQLGAEHDLTMLMVTHQMGFAKEFADRVCFFHSGRICEEGEPRAFFQNPQNERSRQFLRAVLEAG